MTTVARSIRDALRGREPLTDAEFDRLYPEHVQRLSSTHWTPVDVAVRAATLLAPDPRMRVLDVGSGSGKVCCIGAIVTGATWRGVERDPALVTAADRMATRLGVDHQARFTCGDMGAVEWKDYDSLYFFNPFEDVLFAREPTELPHRWTLFGNELERVTAALADLPSGTRVVTYHGFGGDMPAGYVLASMERIGSGQLVLWIKESRRRPTYRTLRWRRPGVM